MTGVYFTGQKQILMMSLKLTNYGTIQLFLPRRLISESFNIISGL